MIAGDREDPLQRPSPLPGQRELVAMSVALVALSRFAEGGSIWVVAGLCLAATMAGALQVLGDDEPRGVPIESLLLPGTVVAGSVGAIRLVDVGPALVLALAALALLVDRVVAIEASLIHAHRSPSPADRTAVHVVAFLVAFVGFAGTAALVAGTLVEPSPSGGSGIPGVAVSELVGLAIGDATIAALVGYRLSALDAPRLRTALWAAVTYGLLGAIGAIAFRVLGLPRFLGPAVLTLVLYLWTAVRSAPGQAQRSWRWIWELALLGALGAVVLAWHVLVRR